MPDTLPNVNLPKGGKWINIYDALGIVIGTNLTIQSLSTASIQFTIKSTEPTPKSGYKLLVKGEQVDIPIGSNGLWISSQSGGSINADTKASSKPVIVSDVVKVAQSNIAVIDGSLLKDSIDEMVIQLKISNMYNAMGYGETLIEEDL